MQPIEILHRQGIMSQMIIRTIWILIFILSGLFVSAQYSGYQKLLDNTSWKYTAKYHHSPYYQFWWHTTGDSMIANKKYVVIEHDLPFTVTSMNRKQFLREDTIQKIVYFLDTNMAEKVLYDFSISIGDSLEPTGFVRYSNGNYFTCDTIEYRQTLWGWRKVFRFDTSNVNGAKEMIEGIGWQNMDDFADLKIFDLSHPILYHWYYSACIYKNRIQQWVEPTVLNPPWVNYPIICASMCPSIGSEDSIQVNKSIICKGDSIRLDAPCDTIHSWVELSNPSVVLDTLETIYVSPNQTSSFIHYGSLTNDTLTIRVQDRILVDLGPDTASCKNEPYQLTPWLSDTTAKVFWSDNSTEKSIVLDSTGIYWIRVRDRSNCFRSSDTIQYTALPIPNALVKDSVLTVNLKANAFVLNNGIPAGGTYFGNGVSNGVFTPSSAGLGRHEVGYVLENQFGCRDTSWFAIVVDQWVSVDARENIFDPSVFPNPTNEQLFISYPEKTLSLIRLKNFSGRIVLEENSLDGNNHKLDVSHLSPGIYLYQVVNSNGQVANGRVVIK